MSSLIPPSSSRLRRQFSSWLVLLALSLVSSPAWAELISPDNPAIRYVGRFTPDKRFAWTGSQIEIAFTGPSVAAKLKLVSGKNVGFTVTIDGKSSRIIVVPGQTTYQLAEGLEANQPHLVRLFRDSEPSFGVVQFEGFELAVGSVVTKPPTPSRKILVIGDSITCGYANATDDVTQGNTAKNQIGSKAYASLAAQKLDADIEIVAWSGRGMFRNNWKQHDTKGTLPKIFDEIIPQEPAKAWPPSTAPPDVIVINLGANDANTRKGLKPELQRADYVNAYREFLQRLRAGAPEAKLLLTLGPRYAPITEDWLQEAAEGMEKVDFLLYAPPEGPQDLGGHYHPSLAKHEKMATALTNKLKQIMGW